MATKLTVSREQDARAFAQALDKLYPSYRHAAERPKGKRLWRVAIYCRASGAFLTYAEG